MKLLEGLIWNPGLLASSQEEELSLVYSVDEKIYAFDRDKDRVPVYRHNEKITSLCTVGKKLYFASKDEIWVWKGEFNREFQEPYRLDRFKGDNIKLCCHEGELYAAGNEWTVFNYTKKQPADMKPTGDGYNPTGLISLNGSLIMSEHKPKIGSVIQMLDTQTGIDQVSQTLADVLAISQYDNQLVFSNGNRIYTFMGHIELRASSAEFNAMHSDGTHLWLGGTSRLILEQKKEAQYFAIENGESGNVTAICQYPRRELFRRGVFNEP